MHGQLAQHFALRSPKAIHLFLGERGKFRGDCGGKKWRARVQKRQYL